MSSNGKKSRQAAEAADMQERAIAEQKKSEKALSRKKKLKGVIIALAAIAAVTALVFCAWKFLYIPKFANGRGTTSGGGSDTKAPIGAKADFSEKYTYKAVDYKGHKFAESIAGMLRDGDEDSAAACEKTGIAMVAAGENISVTEYSKTYIDQFYQALVDSSSSPTIKSDTPPAEQTYSEGVTWKDHLDALADNYLVQTRILFNEALDNSLMLTDDEVLSIEQNRNIIENEAKGLNQTADQYLEDLYCEGMTLGLYMRNMVMNAYATKYSNIMLDAQAKTYSDDDIEKEYAQSRDDYDYVDVRIFSMKPDDEAGKKKALATVKTLDDFYAFASEYYKGTMLNYTRETAEIETMWIRTKKVVLSTKLNNAVADWCFADNRKAGDITVIDGETLDYLIYVLSPRHTNCSFDLHQAVFYYDATTMTNMPSPEQEKLSLANANAALEEFKKSGKTGEDYNKIVGKYFGEQDYGVKGMRCLDENRSVIEWVYDENRKPGDFAVLEVGIGYGFFLFDKLNTDDLDYKYYIRNALTERALDNYYNSLLALNGNEITRFDKKIGEASEFAEGCCAEYIKNYQESLAAQAQQETEAN